MTDAPLLWSIEETARQLGGISATVRVRAVNKPSDAWEMIVSGESVPSYRARVRIALCKKCGLPPGSRCGNGSSHD